MMAPLLFGVLATRGSVTKASASGEWNGSVANMTFSGDDIVNTAGNAWIRTNDSFAGDFSFSFKAHLGSGTSTVLGVYPISADATFNSTDSNLSGGAADISDETGSYTIKVTGAGTFSVLHADSSVDTDTFSAGDTLTLARVGSAFTLAKNGVVITSFVATFSGAVRAFAGTLNAATNLDIRDVSWTQ